MCHFHCGHPVSDLCCLNLWWRRSPQRPACWAQACFLPSRVTIYWDWISYLGGPLSQTHRFDGISGDRRNNVAVLKITSETMLDLIICSGVDTFPIS
jgi:hypothetical protein